MTERKISDDLIKHAWHTYLTTGEMPASLKPPWFERKAFRPILKRLPKSPRCGICYLPFEGIGGTFSRVFLRVERSRLNPNLCNVCELFATEYHGGVELEISMLFADVRGSTSIAENSSPEKFSKLINRFYRTVTEIFYRNYGFVEKLAGDEVAGFFVPGFAGQEHARVAVETGKEILRALGYGGSSRPWIPAGVGIHTGVAYVGSVHTEGNVSNIAILGDAVNTTARLTSLAGVGEILVSEATRQAANLDVSGLECQTLKLKGKSQDVLAWTLKMERS
ncbi:MAG TPA: adenylate/guanylate cyclase domain-containing protein [Anaerolineales bacterium]|nr:adenylate/guanylate cyclase domain-containing protein [Anaerolineales bacterium]